MADLSCPVCKGDSYFNPNIKIYISPCFHRICETCLYRVFQQGYAPCPECGTLLRRINFISSTFEDIEVERELNLRKLLNRHFLRQEAEFSDEVSYNNYLEEYENFLFKLLEIKNEILVKEKINEMKNTNSILLPLKQVGKQVEKEEQPKKVKVEENWCIYNGEIVEKPVINNDVEIPRGFVDPFIPAGLKKEDILRFFVYSFLQISC